MKHISSLALLTLTLLIITPAIAADSPSVQKNDSIQVMEAFENQSLSGKSEISDHKKHLIMFIIAVPLLLLLLVTAALGIAMVVYGKPVFLPHMICAGLSITLAIVHAIVGIVWFNPF